MQTLAVRKSDLGIAGLALAAALLLVLGWLAIDGSAPSPIDRAAASAPGTAAPADPPVAPIDCVLVEEPPLYHDGPATLPAGPETPPETHEGVLAMIEAQSGVPRSEIARRIRARRPQWFDSALVPLEPWHEVAPDAADYFVEGFCGPSVESQREKFEYAIFDESLASFIREHTDERTPPERLAMLESIAEDAMFAFDEFIAEAQVAIMHKVQSDRFDRWPYVTINETRRFTGEERSSTLGLMGGLGRGWVVQLDIYEGEYPTLDVAAQQWEATKSASRRRLKAWMEGQ